MNGITILIWITIALIAIISIILVKLHYRGDELEQDEGSILPSSESISGALSIGKNTSSSNESRRSLSPQSTQQRTTNHNLFRNRDDTPKEDVAYIVPEVANNNLKNYEYESQNQVLINYDNTVEKFQEPIKQNQMDIMTQNNNEDTTELKDLFTIDELIKESKRKDSEREKESQKIRKDEEDAELTDIKESIKNKREEPLIEEIIDETETSVSEEKEETINDIINESSSSPSDDTPEDTAEAPSSASQKDIDEAITTASQETKEEVETISDDENITDALLNKEEEPSEEISEPALKTPNKVDKSKDYKLGASIDDANLFGEDKEEDVMDLDYRKDLDRVTNKIKGSKIFQDVKEKLMPDTPEPEAPQSDETYIRNVNEYDDYEPIINETHADYEEFYQDEYDQQLRQENTRRMFNMTKGSPEPELATPKTETIKDKPSRDNIKVQINNNEVVVKKGDEIIFNHMGETYSSQVYAIKGDDIHVRYRRQDITIKPEDVKKVY